MRRVLIVAPYFPPRRRVGSLRPFRFASHLVELGWRPTVVCLATPGEALSERERVRSRGIERIEIEAPLDRTRRRASGELGQAGISRAPADGEPFARRARAAASSVLDGLDRWLPVDAWAPLLGYGALALLPRLRAAEPALVFSTADPWSSHLFGGWVARQLGVPWVADFRDPWTLCPIRGRGPWLVRALNRAVERGVVLAASRVTFTTERTLRRYADAYPEAASRMTCIPNGFDAAMLGGGLGGEPMPLPASQPLGLCFFGRFRPLSPARAITEALGLLLERRPELRASIRVSQVGTLSDTDAAVARRLGVLDRFEALAPVPYERSLEVLRRHDLSLLSSAPERDDIVPAKLWDYLAAGRPILSLGNNPDVARLLLELSAGVQLGAGDAANVADLLARCIESKQRGEPLPIPARAEQQGLAALEARRLTERLATLFESALGGAAPPAP